MIRSGDNVPISFRFVTIACLFVTCLILANILAIALQRDPRPRSDHRPAAWLRSNSIPFFHFCDFT